MTMKSFSGAAVPTTLDVAINEVDVTFTGDNFIGWPDGSEGPINVTLDRDKVNEEKVLAQSISGTTMLVLQRGYDGTTAKAHAAGATVEHGWFGVDATESNQHVNSTGSAHGLGPGDGSFVGTVKTQTLTNKSMDGSVNQITNLPLGASPETAQEIAGLKNEDTLLQGEITNETAARIAGDQSVTSAFQSADAGHVAALDPHPQYLTPAEGDALFLTPAEGNAAYDGIGAATAAVGTHVAAADPHPQYLTPAEEAALNRVTGSSGGFKMARGTLQVTVAAGIPVSGASGPHPLVFPAGLFAISPNVVISMSSAPGGSGILQPRCVPSSKDAGNVYLYNVGSTVTTGVTVGVDWIAVGT